MTPVNKSHVNEKYYRKFGMTEDERSAYFWEMKKEKIFGKKCEEHGQYDKCKDDDQPVKGKIKKIKSKTDKAFNMDDI